MNKNTGYFYPACHCEMVTKMVQNRTSKNKIKNHRNVFYRENRNCTVHTRMILNPTVKSTDCIKSVFKCDVRIKIGTRWRSDVDRNMVREYLLDMNTNISSLSLFTRSQLITGKSGKFPFSSFYSYSTGEKNWYKKCSRFFWKISRVKSCRVDHKYSVFTIRR